MLYALLDRAGSITVEHLEAALALWRYCEASARLVYSRNGERLAARHREAPAMLASLLRGTVRG